MTTQTLPPGVEELGRLACECELWAQQREMSCRDRHDLMKRAQAYRDEQFRLLEASCMNELGMTDETYTHANVLEEGPNKSETPCEDLRSAFWGIKHALIGEFVIGLVLVICYAIWRHYAN